MRCGHGDATEPVSDEIKEERGKMSLSEEERGKMSLSEEERGKMTLSEEEKSRMTSI